MAQISEGYTGGAIQKTIKRTLTARRLEKLDRHPLQESEFINALSTQEITGKADETNHRRFTSKITGLDDRREKLAEPVVEAVPAKPAKKK